MTVQDLKRRFDELLVQLDEIEKTKKFERGALGGDGDFVDDNLLLGWRVKARNQLSRACGAESEHYRQFESTEARYGTNYEVMLRQKVVFEAAKEDFEGGHVRSMRSFVHAELFDNELEQATELLVSGYTTAAAVVARVVLETTLRTLCGDCNPVIEVRRPDGKWVKLEKLNADLANAGIYDKLVQKQVTWLAGVGNDAAHGNNPVKDDVEAMIAQLRRFVTEHSVK